MRLGLFSCQVNRILIAKVVAAPRDALPQNRWPLRHNACKMKRANPALVTAMLISWYLAKRSDRDPLSTRIDLAMKFLDQLEDRREHVAPEHDLRALCALAVSNLGSGNVFSLLRWGEYELRPIAPSCIEKLRNAIKVTSMGEETQMDAFAAIVHQNDIHTVHKLLAQGIDPNSYSHFFGRAINVAAKQGHLDMVRILLRAGALLDQNSSAVNHDDAVQTAALAGQEDTLKFLVQVLLDSDCSRLPLCVHTAQPYFTGNGMYAVLRHAILSGKQDLCMWLLEKTFSHKGLISSEEYRIIFYRAAGSGQIETMQLLLRPVRRLRLSKSDVAEALCQATRSGSQEGVKLLLSYRFYEDYSNAGESNSPNSARDKHEDFVRDLVKQRTLCAAAAAKGVASIVELLLEHGAELHSRFEEGDAGPRQNVFLNRRYSAKDRLRRAVRLIPLCAAASSASHQILPLLVDRGADIHRRNVGKWALAVATFSGRAPAVRYLVSSGIDPTEDMPMGGSFSPIDVAAAMGHSATVETLREFGARPANGDHQELRGRFFRWRGPWQIEANTICS
jgi:ankyrin repeat protein